MSASDRDPPPGSSPDSGADSGPDSSPDSKSDLDNDHRNTDRIQILGELRGEVMVFQAMTIKEISRGGAQIETIFPLHLDSLHDFRLTLGDRSIVVKGRVVHCQISDVDQELITYRSGVEFVDPPDRVFSVIADFIDAIRDGRRAI